LLILSLGLSALSFFLGPADVTPSQLVAGLFNGHGAAGVIAREIRLPRAALALFVGAALGASGAALQGLFRNPLAEPGVTGVTSSAGLGAVIALYFGLATISAAVLPACAVAGALVSAGVLYYL
jgi:iron complex transport system permease protein